MRTRQPLPLLWLLSDARNDVMLERALASLPSQSGFVFRHYHLPPRARVQRFEVLARIARKAGHMVLVAGTQELAREIGADGIYGTPAQIAPAHGMTRLATAHGGDELAAAERVHADGVFLSPVFPTASHPQAPKLGVHGFHVLAQQSPVPVIALGGLNEARAVQLAWPRWGAIDGLVSPQPA